MSEIINYMNIVLYEIIKFYLKNINYYNSHGLLYITKDGEIMAARPSDRCQVSCCEQVYSKVHNIIKINNYVIELGGIISIE